MVRRATLAALGLGLAIASACGGDFEAASKIDTVRILASRADKPYAKPGDTVKVDVLAYDGRADKSRAMQLYWLPIVCENPTDDLYYACFAPGGASLHDADGGLLGANGDAGAIGDGGAGGDAGAGSPLSKLPVGIDLSPFLPTGPSYSFTLAQDIIAKHPPVPGTPAPYGLAIVFNVACAGHLEIKPQDPTDLRKQQVPIGCFDENHVELDPSQYVIGFTRVYAYDSLTNANPTIDAVTFQGQPLDTNAGVTAATCHAQHRQDCPELKIGITVPDTSWEVNPGDSSNNGNAHEEIWADYYSTSGDWKSDARLLYDTKAGKLTDVDDSFFAPADPTEGQIFIVVHDNRNGANWTSFPLHVQ